MIVLPLESIPITHFLLILLILPTLSIMLRTIIAYLEDCMPMLSLRSCALRVVLLAISMVCVVMTFIVIGLIVRYKRLKVIKAGSPIFLAVTLLGCVAMYMEVRVPKKHEVRDYWLVLCNDTRLLNCFDMALTYRAVCTTVFMTYLCRFLLAYQGDITSICIIVLYNFISVV